MLGTEQLCIDGQWWPWLLAADPLSTEALYRHDPSFGFILNLHALKRVGGFYEASTAFFAHCIRASYSERRTSAPTFNRTGKATA